MYQHHCYCGPIVLMYLVPQMYLKMMLVIVWAYMLGPKGPYKKKDPDSLNKRDFHHSFFPGFSFGRLQWLGLWHLGADVVLAGGGLGS